MKYLKIFVFACMLIALGMLQGGCTQQAVRRPPTAAEAILNRLNEQGLQADYEADYCLYDPTKDDPGICVFQDCEAGTCPAESLCCDCTLFPVTLCLEDGVLSNPALEAACDCTP